MLAAGVTIHNAGWQGKVLGPMVLESSRLGVWLYPSLTYSACIITAGESCVNVVRLQVHLTQDGWIAHGCWARVREDSVLIRAVRQHAVILIVPLPV